MGTLVERTTRYTKLIHLPREDSYGRQPRVHNGPALAGYGAFTMKNPLAEAMATLPENLHRLASQYRCPENRTPRVTVRPEGEHRSSLISSSEEVLPSGVALFGRTAPRTSTTGRANAGIRSTSSSLPEPVSRRAWSALAFAVAVVTAGVLALVPVVATSSCVATSDGAMHCSASGASLLGHEGKGVLGVLALPALLAVVPVLFPSPRSRVAAAVALTAATLVALASVGVSLLPTVLVAWMAVANRQRCGRRARPDRD